MNLQHLCLLHLRIVSFHYKIYLKIYFSTIYTSNNILKNFIHNNFKNIYFSFKNY